MAKKHQLTVALDDEQKAWVQRSAARRRVPEAQVVRDALYAEQRREEANNG